MGNPQHFSLELPQRCLQLLHDLYDNLPAGDDCGSVPLKLRATFLLSISMPMINLPIERIHKYRDDGLVHAPQADHVNDFALNQKVADAVKAAIDDTILLKDAPFFSEGWRYIERPKGGGFPDLARHGLPQDTAQALQSPASEAGSKVSTKVFCDVLRNAMAHGGVLFLNEQGESSQGDPVRMFTFVSTDRMNNPTALRFLRIGMKDYRAFLKKWTTWLKKSGLQRDIEKGIGQIEAVEPQAAVATAG